jgi:hypothetical protein
MEGRGATISIICKYTWNYFYFETKLTHKEHRYEASHMHSFFKVYKLKINHRTNEFHFWMALAIGSSLFPDDRSYDLWLIIMIPILFKYLISYWMGERQIMCMQIIPTISRNWFSRPWITPIQWAAMWKFILNCH